MLDLLQCDVQFSCVFHLIVLLKLYRPSKEMLLVLFYKIDLRRRGGGRDVTALLSWEQLQLKQGGIM